MKIIAITQARYGSTRLPGKVLKTLHGKTLLAMHLERALGSKKIDKLIVATTTEPEASEIEKIALSLNCEVYKGSTTDVLDRYYQAAKKEAPDYIVRITSDCPLVDHRLMDKVIDTCTKGKFDFCANTLNPTFPDGVDVEVFSFAALEKAWKEATLPSDREHVTPYIWRNSSVKGEGLFKSFNYPGEKDYSRYRLTVDEPTDFELIKQLVLALGDQKEWIDYVNYLEQHKEVFEINAHIKRNEGFMKSLEKDKKLSGCISNFSKSDNYRKKIHDLIPGGSHTYSKGDDQFPALSPAAIAHGKGAYVWDLDGNKYLDCPMGLTSVSLGHAYEPVLKRVVEEIYKGANFQRPSYLEMEMAERFLSLVPQHQMIKFAKNGSTVTTAAVKLARAYTGRKLVAFPYDHPFYSYDDWFIGKTACNKGVPEDIQHLSVTYKADDLKSLEELFNTYPGQIACVISEPEKDNYLPQNYLQDAINLAHKHGALYIVDEMITGFKTDFPGSIKKYNVKPDMATWGKGIANGFAFCALTGIKEVMELGGIRDTGAEKVFLTSTTHGGETSAMAACLATIDEFENNNVLQHNHSIGRKLHRICKEIISGKGMTEFIDVNDTDWWPIFTFKDTKGEVSLGMKTVMMQEMIVRGVLFNGFFVPCFSHTEEDVHYFANALEESMSVYSKAVESGFESFLTGPVIKPVFRKYL